jgi:hypothetical protein
MEKAHLYEALYLVNHGIDEAVINLQFMLEMRKLEENDESYFEEEFNV